jgi:hypothetical protein
VNEKMSYRRLRESAIYKVFIHEDDDDQKTYWLLCRKERHGEHWSWRILRKFSYISGDGKIYDA